MTISSVGLTRQFHQNAVLGKYGYDGDSNGKPSYKGPGGKYLQFSPGGEWMVSNLSYPPTQLTLNMKSPKIITEFEMSHFHQFKVSSEKNSSGGYLDSNCKADCPSLCDSWKTFEPNKKCTPKCPWVEDSALRVTCGKFKSFHFKQISII